MEADLPYREFLNAPITGIAHAGDTDVWALTYYGYRFIDRSNTRWNTVAYHSRNDGLFWNMALDGDYPGSEAFRDVLLFSASFADRDHGWFFGVRRPGVASMDQQQPASDGADTASDVWQSFTAGRSGLLTAVQLDVSGSGAWSGTLSIHAGEGTAGGALYSRPAAGNGDGPQTFLLEAPVSVVNGSRYTIRLSASTPLTVRRSASNPYPGGRASTSAETDFVFQTTVRTYGEEDPPGDYVFLYTSDRGRSWSAATLPNQEPALSDPTDFKVQALDAERAVAVQGRHVFETTGANVWRERSGQYPHLTDVHANSLNDLHVSGIEGTAAVAGTVNGPTFTQQVSAPGAFHAITFGAPDSVWAAGVDATGAGQIFGRKNGAWNQQLAVPGMAFHAVVAPTGLDAWAVAGGPAREDSGAIYRTADGGASWRLERATPDRLFSLSFRDAFHGWAGGESGLYRYVPPIGDVNRNGRTDAGDAAEILQAAGGTATASPEKVAEANRGGTSGTLDLADALLTLRLRAEHGQPTRAVDDPGGVVVLYNTVSADTDGNGVGDSRQVAEYYANRRDIPLQNLVPITWSNPLEFSGRSLIEGEGLANWTDAYRAIVLPVRERIAALGRWNVNAIVFTRDVPFRFQATMPAGVWDTVTLDTAIMDLWRLDETSWASRNPYAAPFSNIGDRYGRPRFEGAGRPSGQAISDATGRVSSEPYYLVSRLDGPTLDACLAMVDNAVFADRHHGPGGYQGIAYIDTRASRFQRPPYNVPELAGWLPDYGNFTDADQSIARAMVPFERNGLPWKDEVTSASIGGPPVDEAVNGPRWRDGTPATTAPRAMFYAGWYNYTPYYDAWDWLPGSVGIDLNSASAYDFRGHSSVSYFAPGAIGSGLTALVGVIAEPYTTGHPKPDALMEYLVRGYTFGEAASLSADKLRTGKAIFLGDPLYRPFKPGPAEPVPVPTLTATHTRSGTGWTVTVESSIPTRMALHFAEAGQTATPSSPQTPATPDYFARRHTFSLPAEAASYLLRATDPTGRVTDAAVQLLS